MISSIVQSLPKHLLEMPKAKLSLPFPVRRVYCVGRNYAEHRKEMGGGERDLPFFFQKPHDSIFQSDTVEYPRGTDELSHEVELVAIMESHTKLFGYALGIDLTKRDIQASSKKSGRPWESSKSFDYSGLLGQVMETSSVPLSCSLELRINGILKQQGKLDQMIWEIPELIEQLQSQDFSVQKGDVIFTGTPAGVGPLIAGDVCEARLVGLEGADVLPKLCFRVRGR
jgi:fumarylpyruvate hydrolase